MSHMPVASEGRNGFHRYVSWATPGVSQAVAGTITHEASDEGRDLANDRYRARSRTSGPRCCGRSCDASKTRGAYSRVADVGRREPLGGSRLLRSRCLRRLGLGLCDLHCLRNRRSARTLVAVVERPNRTQRRHAVAKGSDRGKFRRSITASTVGGTQLERDEKGRTSLRLRDIVVRDATARWWQVRRKPKLDFPAEIC